jgi:hypothetical protein
MVLADDSNMVQNPQHKGSSPGPVPLPPSREEAIACRSLVYMGRLEGPGRSPVFTRQAQISSYGVTIAVKVR